MVNEKEKYESWKNKLLDLGKRNRLINYGDRITSRVAITNPDCYELYQKFVEKEEVIIFPTENVNTKNKANVKTDKKNSDLQKTLKALRYKAKTAAEEMGINVLYLSFGFLTWRETEYSDQKLKSPLILIPVNLSLENITSPFILNLHDDEIVCNPTLLYKLKLDFGIELPEFKEGDDLLDYFKKVKDIVEPKGWSITENVDLSILSFLKINMYKDLNINEDKILSNKLIKAIMGNSIVDNDIPDDLESYDFDANDIPTDVFQILDADSSQLEAIRMAKMGKSFVLQGPPGTGKSQTIANIIAERLAQKKTILFVSEKKAALDVVYSRLEKSGLADFCLVLHSHKASKKTVLEQLDKTIKLKDHHHDLKSSINEELQKLEEDINKLNKYAKEVYEVIPPLNKSIYEVNGIISNLEGIEYLKFPVNDVKNTTQEKYNNYINLIKKMSMILKSMPSNIKLNPWYGYNSSIITSEIRYDLHSYTDKLVEKLKAFDIELESYFVKLKLDNPHTINEIKKIISVLDEVKNSYRVPSSWILSNDNFAYVSEFEKCKKLKENITLKLNELADHYNVIKANNTSILLSNIESLNSLTKIVQEKAKLNDYIQKTIPYCLWTICDQENIKSLIDMANEYKMVIETTINEINKEYENKIYKLDYEKILDRMIHNYSNIFRIFKKSYQLDKQELFSCYIGNAKKYGYKNLRSVLLNLKKIDDSKKWFISNKALFETKLGNCELNETSNFTVYQKSLNAYVSMANSIDTLNELIELYKEVVIEENHIKDHLEFLYTDIFLDWDELKKKYDWAISFKEKIKEIKLSDEFIKSLCYEDGFIDVCNNYQKSMETFLLDIKYDYNMFISNFNDDEVFNKMTLLELRKRVLECVNNFSLLEEYVDYMRTKQDLISIGLEEFVNIIEVENVDINKLVDIFKKRFFHLWLDAILPNYPEVLNFRAKNQEEIINEFRKLDKKQFTMARDRIKKELIDQIPSDNHFVSGLGESGILKTEITKKRKQMPIRVLFKNIPNLLIKLKPCLMMSPLSVSLFLESDLYKFDTVIFDEASQISTENAIGAISRGKQVIIAGDSKQLPPTDFFNTASSELDYDDSEEDEMYDDTDAYESILDEARCLPSTILKWHYRSRHEGLIAFSNAKIYNNQLVTFPSNIDKKEGYGVEYIYVENGYYDKGGKNGNVNEAAKVAELVFKHFKGTPNKSLGVITFGTHQQEAIEAAITKIRVEHPEFEIFFKDDRYEPFFIKNLENVQGDERDVIIFSIGYAKDINGKFLMNFGPLNKVGGERRLNVAITRAKYNLKLVGSILPTDIDLNRTKSEGAKLLRAYIDYAKNGINALQNEISEDEMAECESSFEESVYDYLISHGYNVAKQVGCSEYRIDLAVKHPVKSGEYILGIECDGASYHSARTARERDRLRQEVLEKMGWKIYRIWSTDWIKDSFTAGQKLLEAVKKAELGTENDINDPSSSTESKEDEESYLSVEERKNNNESIAEEYGFEKNIPINISKLPYYVDDAIIEIVNKRYPIHFDELCQYLAHFYGNEKVTSKVKKEVEYELTSMQNKIIRKDDFLYPVGYKRIIVRYPNFRKNINYISNEEIVCAMLMILKKSYGVSWEELCRETEKVFGFNHTSPNISVKMNLAVIYLINNGLIKHANGKITVLKPE